MYTYIIYYAIRQHITAWTVVVAYTLLYKPWALSMGEGDFRPPTVTRPLNRLSWKYITTSRTSPRMRNFRGLCRRVWSGQIASLTHESFCHFFFLSHAHRLPFWTHPNAQYVIIRRFRQDSAFWGLERWNLIFVPLYPQNVKNGTFSWRSMQNCNGHNSGKVSRIHLKLGTGIDHPSGITWHNSKVKRSKVKVTGSRNVFS